ncbi:dihydroxyacetone kinase phosphoryl donor subunit DhaM [Isoptericola variabilis]|uniref:Phosphocarrier protein HPr n=1 Tax=Isoptericola variabilis (strain 225) TaxID=743718 RepID=F6FRU2_ISOV2|nr:dihydroxyacetone kinase phosphoryl donor subunit DhaM [Isoptericola variabilis]AEG43943.1 dihydroxyacetone kinase, phosphotransfer subunit [Isoptericola variabilis 225]TWH30536.1 PTS hybrid protein [Isoptericola variabilis J7]
MTVGLVLVSHSVLLAEGTAELAREMAPDVVVRVGAGDAEGGLGTSLERVQAALEDVLAQADAAIVLADLGSAVLTVETAFEVDESLAGRARLVSAPFVEGAVAAAVTAQQGAGADAVAAAAEGAVTSIGQPGPVLELVETRDTGGAAGTVLAGEAVGVVEAPGAEAPGAQDGVVTARVTVPNPLGLHARPAAVLARTVADLGVPMTVDGVDATSVLQLLALGATGGRELEIAARGERAEAAVAVVVGLIEGGFGEV